MSPFIVIIAACIAQGIFPSENLVTPIDNAPHLPSHEIASQQFYLARDHRDWVEEQWFAKRVPPVGKTWKELYEDAEYRLSVWSAVCDIRQYSGSSPWKNREIRRLKRLIGESDYWSARLPNSVPLWRFER